MNATDQQFLAHAVRIGARGLGRTWPNPSVGCVLVKEGAVLAAARTGDGGRPHAETQALALAGDARNATAYVSLEPCAHHGVTPPCAEALIQAGISRVVVGAVDPDPRVAGRGIAMLEAAGIQVDVTPSPAAAQDHRGFFKRLQQGLPYVAMKLASSLDGQTADHAGKSQWITGEAARTHGHSVRAHMDAIITGIGTVLADDPRLTARAGSLHDRLVRVVCDRQLRLPLTSTLVKTAQQQPVWVITGAEAVEAAASHAVELREAGVKLVVLEDAALPPRIILETLAKEGITRALIEAGPGLSTAFLAAHLVDRLYWYRAPLLLGNDGQPAIRALGVQLDEATHGRLSHRLTLGKDQCDIYELAS